MFHSSNIGFGVLEHGFTVLILVSATVNCIQLVMPIFNDISIYLAGLSSRNNINIIKSYHEIKNVVDTIFHLLWGSLPIHKEHIIQWQKDN